MVYPARQLIITNDGSHTIAIPDMKVTYHSHHGAIQESSHVCIEAGLKYVLNNTKLSTIHIFEMGFGTGLNALLTLIEAEQLQQAVHYTAIEPYPLEQHETSYLNYCEQLKRPDLAHAFKLVHQCEWEKDNDINPLFTLNKIKQPLENFQTSKLTNLIYYDAFSPTVQPELWTKEIFEHLFSILLPGGILVTYCSKSDVRRAMQAAGFAIQKITGPWGKREMVRATKRHELPVTKFPPIV